MSKNITGLTAIIFLIFVSISLTSQSYFPPLNEWETKTPEQMGVSSSLIQEAIDFANNNESSLPRDMEVAHYMGFGKEPYGYAIGPLKERGPSTGLIIKDGYIIADWGDPKRVDMTHSVTKTFLSSVVGLAYDQGMIQDIHDKVNDYMAPVTIHERLPVIDKANDFGANEIFEPFAEGHNNQITWDDLLRQTSDWSGTLWGKPDWADRPDKDRTKWINRELKTPGTVYEYNDVRVNVLALAILNVWRKPLQEVLKEQFMNKIGASSTWRWHGYENSWIVLDGQLVQVPSGGGHWGGGMFINAFDQARLGYLTLHGGNWNGDQILSKEWVKMAMTPGVRKTYGFMNWFLNTDQELIKTAPKEAFAHFGAGTNMVYVDPVHDLVIVARWIDRSAIDGFVEKVLAAITE